MVGGVVRAVLSVFNPVEIVRVKELEPHRIEAHVSFYAGEIREEVPVFFAIKNLKPWTSIDTILALVDQWAEDIYGYKANDVMIDGKRWTWSYIN